ncbi:MAG: hypothetical protein ACQESR_25895 [Planctomycetota bacterium]
MTPAWCLQAETVSSTLLRFTRLQAMSQWWHWLLLIAVCAVVAGHVIVMYWRDGVELSRGVRWSLVLLRILAFAGILFFFLDLEKRTEQREVKPSRVALLVDTSQSMAIKDADSPSANPSTSLSRGERIVAELGQGPLLERLRQRHEVAVYTFDEGTEPAQVAFLDPLKTDPIRGNSVGRAAREKEDQLRTARHTMLLVAGLAGIALMAFLVYLFLGRASHRGETPSLAFLVAMVALVAAVVVFAVANLRAGEFSLPAIVGLDQPDIETEVAEELAAAAAAEKADETGSKTMEPASWRRALRPRGTKTRLGDAVRSLVGQERGGPIAGIVLMTDGGSNAGVDCAVAAEAARMAEIPIYAVGMGSTEQPVNVHVADLEAPKRVFPGDRFSLAGYIQAHGLEGKQVSVELFSAPADDSRASSEDPTENATFEEERTIRLTGGGEVDTVDFEVTPSEQGNWQYFLKVVPPEEDIEPRDNVQSARVTVVDRKTKVLLMAGGPMREFRFLRNQLFRDSDTTLHVLLQSGATGMSQEADDVWHEFPELADELFEYDCIIAFDFDWLQLDELQVELLDRYVAEQAGGLIVIAGPVMTPEWAGLRRGEDPRIDTIKTLYPVVFYSQGLPSLGLGRFGGKTAWPLKFTQDGLAAEFLRLEDDPIDSEAAWQSFDGVYGYYAVKAPKPGARIYAYFSNPEASLGDDLPIYAAGHFYGAGRVFFQASGEMWRLRALDPRYFETYYTKLIRWASQGRLLRDSSLGLLLVEKDRCMLGEQVTVRAMLSDVQHRPLQLESVPAMLLQPDGTRESMVLRQVQNAARDGMYEAQFPALQVGDYRIEVTPTEDNREELLTAKVRVRAPTLEIEQPQLDEPLLVEMCETTEQLGGAYFRGFDAAMNRTGANRTTLAATIQPNNQVVYLPESIDKSFDQKLMGWLMGLIVGFLCLEWLVRRLSKLA